MMGPNAVGMPNLGALAPQAAPQGAPQVELGAPAAASVGATMFGAGCAKAVPQFGNAQDVFVKSAPKA